MSQQEIAEEWFTYNVDETNREPTFKTSPTTNTTLSHFFFQSIADYRRLKAICHGDPHEAVGDIS